MRDYRLTGNESRLAAEKGLVDANWYTCPVPREKIRELLLRKNGPAIIDTAIWFGLLFGSAYLVVLLWGSWWFLLPYFFYSLVYASSSDSRWHESSHGTAFKTSWMNNTLYEIASFMVVRQSTVWRWSHTRHHSDTLIRGRDPEIAVPRPPNFTRLLLSLFAVNSTVSEFRRIFMHAVGKIDPEVATYLPASETRTVSRKARIYLAIYLGVIALSIAYTTILPLLFIGIPTFVGSWLMRIYGWTQHAGLEENVLDFRLNCRTVKMNFINRYLYWNMNYHVEHHMFPMVPYHALPKLHRLIKNDCPPAYKSIFHAYKEIIPTLIKQRKDPGYFAVRHLPANAGITQSASKKFIALSKDADLNGLVKICGLEDLPKNDVIRFDLDDSTLAVYRNETDNYFATDGICTHGNTHLADGFLFGDLIECPKHNGRFNITDGSPQRLPVCKGLKKYKVISKDGVLYFDLNSAEVTAEVEKRFDFKVVSNENLATFIKELVLESAGESGDFSFRPGDYIQLEIPVHETSFESFEINKDFKRIWKQLNINGYSSFNHTRTRRNYSLAVNPSSADVLKFNVRIAIPPLGTNHNSGVGSTYVFNLKPGDLVSLSGPFGDFHINETDREMIYVGGGAGMAPIRSHISYLFETLKTNRKVSYWYGARSARDLFYEDYFRSLAETHPHFSFHVAFSETKKPGNPGFFKGFIHEVLEKEYLEKLDEPDKKEYYLCGPPAMIEAMTKLLEKYKVPEEQIRFDEF